MDDAVKKYQELFPAYEAFASRMESLLLDMLDTANIKAHFTESRAKPVDSFAEKLNRPGKSYGEPLADMPDLAGVRLVLYYLDDIKRVGELIRQEFDIIEEVTEHQADQYSADQFGYLSMHYIVNLNAARNGLPEWKSFAEFRVEIQVRTVLQHSWAAVSHALQYKIEGDVPFRLRRQLFRLAGLFELADEEFVAIRDTKEEITATTKATPEHELKKATLDAPVIRRLMTTSSQLRGATALMRSIGYEFDSAHDDSLDEYVGRIVEECERLSIRTVDDLETAVNYDWEPFLRTIFARDVDEDDEPREWVVSGPFAFYLLLIGAFPDSFTIAYLVKSGWHRDTARRVVDGATSREG